STLLNPVPGPEPERLMQIAEQNREQQQAGFFNGVGPPVLQALRENQDFFSDLVWADIAIPFSRKTGDFTERVQGSRASSDFFGFWNARPILGRTFAPDEAVPIGKDGMPSALTQVIRKELKAAEPAMGTPDIHVVKQQLYDSTLARRTYMSSLMV